MSKGLNPRVVNMIERRLKKDPEVGTSELYESAVMLMPGLKTRGKTSFHARYTLPIRRKLNGTDRGYKKHDAKPEKRAAKKSTRRASKRTRPAPEQTPELEIKQLAESAPITQLPVHVPKARTAVSRREEAGVGQNEHQRAVLQALFADVAQEALQVENRADMRSLLASIKAKAEEAARLVS